MRRPARSAFAPGKAVFCGGSVGPGDDGPWPGDAPATDGEASADSHPGGDVPSGPPASVCAPTPETALRGAAIRELWEEAGVVLATGAGAAEPGRVAAARARLLAGTVTLGEALAAAGLGAPALADLAYGARWITPAGLPIRFDTAFFAARLPDGQTADATAAGGEVDGAGWWTPADSLAAERDGRLALMLPTRVTLADLATYPDVDALMAAWAAREPAPVQPEPVALADGRPGLRVPWLAEPVPLADG